MNNYAHIFDLLTRLRQVIVLLEIKHFFCNPSSFLFQVWINVDEDLLYDHGHVENIGLICNHLKLK